MGVTKSSKSDKIPHTNLIQHSFKIEDKVMETSDSMAWECKSFNYGFIGFKTKENKEMKLNFKKSYIYFTTSSNPYNIPHTNPI